MFEHIRNNFLGFSVVGNGGYPRTDLNLGHNPFPTNNINFKTVHSDVNRCPWLVYMICLTYFSFLSMNGTHLKLLLEFSNSDF